MKKQLFFTIALFWCSLVSFGQTFSDNGISYTITGTVSPLTVSVSSFNPNGISVANIPASVVSNGNNYSVTSLDLSAFYTCTSLTSVTIPNTVTSIGNNAFYGCSGLTSISIPNSVTSIGSAVFQNCSNLTSVTIPNSITTIGNNVFFNCSKLTSLTIPNSVTSIGIGCFRACTGLTSIIIPNSVASLGISSFFGCTGLTSVTIPNSVTSIGTSAFGNCTSLTSIIIPNSVTSISANTFRGCTGLTSVTIPNSVTSIIDSAFANCAGLTSLSIPNSVTSIGSIAFQNCIGLTDVTVNWATPLTNISINSFQGVNLANVKLYVPLGTIGDYNAALVWTGFNILTLITATQSQTDVSCNGGANGSASVVASGGAGNYDFLWSNGWTFSIANNLIAGNYSCTITDAAMNSIVKNFVITAPDSIEIIPTQTDISCFGGNGTATVSASGGTGLFTYLWTPNGGNGATATGLIAGDYFCKITDANGCNKYQGFTITEPNEIFLSGIQADIDCFGGANGSADVTPFNGTAPYTYLWNNGATSQSINSLAAGNYNVVVTDNKGCTASRGYVISQPTELTTAGSQNNVPCSGATIDTFATVTPSGGTAPYTYSWNNGASSQTISEIAAGSYFITVYDSNGCSAFRNFTITLDITPLPSRNSINGTLCEPSTYADLASKFDNSNTIKIYATTTSTTPLNPQDFIAPIGTNVTYYITQTLNGCESARLAYSAFVNTLPTPTAFDQNFCGSGFEVGNLVATLSQNASSLKWYDVPTGGNALSSTVPLVSGNYYVTQNKYPCGESARKMITVTISLPTDNVSTISTCDSYTWNSTTYNQTGIYVGTTTNCITEKLDLTITTTPIISGNETQNFNVTDTIANIIVSPTSIVWYANLADANAGTSPLLATQVLANNTTYYAVTTGICPSIPFAVLVETTLVYNTFSNNLNIELYPNPNTGIFNLKLLQDLQIEVYNNLGQLLLSEKMLSGSNVINIADKPVGVYFLKANDGNNVSTFKIIKN